MLAIELKKTRDGQHHKATQCCAEDGEDRDLFYMICEMIHESQNYTFFVSGFNCNSWPVDICTDLPIIISQLESAIAGMADCVPFQLDFVEQGVERILQFIPHKKSIIIECHPLLGGDLIGEPDIVPGQLVAEMLVNLFTSFVDAAKACCHVLTVHSDFDAWEKRVTDLVCMAKKRWFGSVELN